MNYFKPKNFLHYAKIKRLYKKAFPPNERKPFSLIRAMQKKGKTDIWYFEDNNNFVGLVITINSDDIILIDYLAVDEKSRSKGYGTKILDCISEHYKPRSIFLEIEIPYESAENYKERVRRKNFYINAGFTPMNTYAKLFGVDMELMGKGCFLDYEGYRNFYLKNYGRFAYENISEADTKS